MAQGDPRKWFLPGWRIEQRYSNGVLIGNWAEERNTFNKGDCQHNSTHRTDFKNYGNFRPDVTIRRKAMLKNDGMGPEYLFHHHGKKYSNNMISWYDENYNGRYKECTRPALRTWNGHRLSWGPEKSDHPLQAEPTNYGVYEKTQERWKEQIADETKGDYLSTYQNSYQSMPAHAFHQVRSANPKNNSSTLHAYNKINKDWNLRNLNVVVHPERVQLPKVST